MFIYIFKLCQNLVNPMLDQLLDVDYLVLLLADLTVKSVHKAVCVPCVHTNKTAPVNTSDCPKLHFSVSLLTLQDRSQCTVPCHAHLQYSEGCVCIADEMT